MIQVLLENPLLLLFVVAAIGYPLGQISVSGSSLGVAAVLFVGLAFGALHPDMKLPELVFQIGLVVFVYTIGISSGRQFFDSFKRKGLRDNLFVLVILGLAIGLVVVAHIALGLHPALTAGLFTGSLTNTAALAGVLEALQRGGPDAQQSLSLPVIGFSIAYPMGVIGMILAINLMRWIWRIDYAREAQSVPELAAGARRLETRTIAVTRPEAKQATIQELIDTQHWDVLFGRIRHNDQLTLSDGQTRLAAGDLVTVVGPVETLDQVTAYLGHTSDEQLELDRHDFDFRRVFVSNRTVAGRRVRDLQLPQQFGAIVTRVRRGDVETLAHGDTLLELGDRVRVVAHRDRMNEVSTFFGDSYRALSEIDILTFNLGLALGLLLGMVPIPLPGEVTIRLGFAGGPLIVALILGALGRTGPLVWSIPYSANLTLRQIGLVLFLAGVGTRAGYEFVSTLFQGGAGALFLVGTLITTITALAALLIGYKLLKIPMNILIGMLAGIQTQPAVLGFALEQTKNEAPNIGYAAVYPIALIGKILLAQVLLVLLS
jgi:putative transport protein